MITNGYIYLVADRTNDVYKIGLTRKSVEKRIKQLQTGNANELELVYSCPTEFPFRLETLLHRKYKPNQAHSEWFYLTLEQVRDFPSVCQNMNEMIDVMKDNIFFSKGLC